MPIIKRRISKAKDSILFILHYPPPVHGSSMVGLNIKNSAELNKTFDCQYINLSTSYYISEIGKNVPAKFFRFSLILWKIFTSLIIFKPKLCYVSITAKCPGFLKDFLIILILKMFRTKLIYHMHNKGVVEFQGNPVCNLFYHLAFRKVKIILLSKHLFSDIKKYVKKDNVNYCPNGIPKNDETKSMIIDNNSTIKILFLSNLIESKGVYVLLEACKLLKQQQLPFHCIFVGGEGDISTNTFNKKVKEFGLTKAITYLGIKHGRDKEDVFLQSDIFVLPSFNDCFPLVLIEAMQKGLPIISTFEGGIPDIIEDNKTGFLIPQKNVIKLAEKLEVLIESSSLRQKMGDFGKKKYKKEFTLDSFEKRLKTILSKVINENN